MQHYKDQLLTHLDFPQPGIVFYDFSPLLSDPVTFKKIIVDLSDKVRAYAFDYIAGVDARGFIFGGALALHCEKGFVMVRKAGKLPGATTEQSYSLEYGSNKLSIQEGFIKPGARVLIIDDILATGGTARTAGQLIEQAGGVIAAIAFVLELPALNGRAQLPYAVETWLVV